MSQRRDEFWQIILGCLLLLGINGLVLLTLSLQGAYVVVAACFSVFTPTASSQQNWDDSLITSISYVISSIGIVQLLYVVPLVILFMRQQQWEWMKGIILGAVLTALLNAVFFFK